MKKFRWLYSLALAVVAGCAINPAELDSRLAGQTREAILARFGQPTRIVHLASGDRLQYCTQPNGRYAVMVDLDGSGRVVRARQVLTAEEFARIEVGKWTREDVEREFGPPGIIDRVASWDGPIMNYRWYGSSEMFFWVYLDGHDVVQRTQQGMEFFNAPNDKN